MADEKMIPITRDTFWLSISDVVRDARATPTVSPLKIMGTATNACSCPPVVFARALTLLPEFSAETTSGVLAEATGASGDFPTSANTVPSAANTVTLISENSAARTLAD